MVENIDNYGCFMSYQYCYMLFNLKKEKSCKRSVGQHFRIGVSAFAGSPYMKARDQLWYMMSSSASHGDALILSGTDVSFLPFG